MNQKHERWLVVACFLGFLSFRQGNYWSWSWHSRYAALLWISSLFFSFLISKRTTLFFLPILIWSLFSAVWVGAYGFNHFRGLPIAMTEGLGHDALYGMICVMIAGLLVAFFPQRLVSTARQVLAMTCIASSVYTIFQFSLTPFERGAFMGNASMNGCLIAATLPFVLRTLHPWAGAFFLVLAGVAVFMTDSSQSIGVLAVVMVVLPAAEWSRWFPVFKLRRLAIFPVAGILLLLSGYLVQGPNFLGDSGRFVMYKQFFEWWAPRFNHWTGAGLGTSLHLLSLVNLQKGQNDNVFLWMHSEPLQILFELGYIGLVSALLAFGWLVWQARREPVLLSSLLGFAAMSIFNYPFRIAVSAGAVTIVAALIVERSKRKWPSGQEY